jgi:hypothetical protein
MALSVHPSDLVAGYLSESDQVKEEETAQAAAMDTGEYEFQRWQLLWFHRQRYQASSKWRRAVASSKLSQEGGAFSFTNVKIPKKSQDSTTAWLISDRSNSEEAAMSEVNDKS